MEEDIKILEEHLSFIKNFDNGSKYIPALENLVKGYRELEEENKNLKYKFTKNGRILFTPEAIAEKHIPKSKIKDKIEEYKQEMKEIRAKEKGLIWNHRLHKLDYAIEVLQELMEDK